MITIVAVASIAFAAGVVQRTVGMGFALVSAGPLVLLYGPSIGVRVVAALGFEASLLMLGLMWNQVEWRRSWPLIWPGIVIAPVAAVVTAVSPTPALLLLVAFATVSTLTASRVTGLLRFLRGSTGALVAGSLAGFLNVTSGLSGPPLVAYAQNERWEQAGFVASAQGIFVAYDVLTMAWRGRPGIPVSELLLLTGIVAAGVWAGSILTDVVSPRYARVAMVGIAWFGAAIVSIRAGVLLAH